jgi:DNA topoisomerase-3
MSIGVRFFLCEKRSQGKDIARILGAGQRRNGCYTDHNRVVIWCIGHLIEATTPKGFCA